MKIDIRIERDGYGGEVITFCSPYCRDKSKRVKRETLKVILYL